MLRLFGHTVRPHSAIGSVLPADLAKLSVPCNAAGCCAHWGLRAPPRCTIEPDRLKMTNGFYSTLDEIRGSQVRTHRPRAALPPLLIHSTTGSILGADLKELLFFSRGGVLRCRALSLCCD